MYPVLYRLSEAMGDFINYLKEYKSQRANVPFPPCEDVTNICARTCIFFANPTRNHPCLSTFR